MVYFFLENCNVKIDIKSKEGFSVMAFAAKYGNANILRYFNEKYNLDYNKSYDNRHLLFLSVENGNLNSLKFFLDEKNINAIKEMMKDGHQCMLQHILDISILLNI